MSITVFKKNHCSTKSKKIASHIIGVNWNMWFGTVLAMDFSACRHMYTGMLVHYVGAVHIGRYVCHH